MTVNSTMDSAEWVDSDERLSLLCQQWRQEPALALDTEFIRTRTFFPHIGLLQIADSQGIYLIDPLAIEDKTDLRNMLEDDGIRKVIHSCSEDLEVFERFLGVVPKPLFDTQVAAAFAGFGSSISYANLVQVLIGDTIPKQETRSDWLQRPLSQSQLRYAALDVEHLLEIESLLIKKLHNTQHLSWLAHECQQIVDRFSQGNHFDDYYLRIKSAWKLQPHQLAVLRALCAWREQEARAVDIPRNHLVKDSSLFDMARVLPKEAHSLFRLRDVQPRFVDRYGEKSIELISAALAAEEEYPQALPRPLSSDRMALFKALKEQVTQVAETLSIPPEYLARKKDIEALVHQKDHQVISLPLGLGDWREEIIGRPLIDRLKELR